MTVYPTVGKSGHYDSEGFYRERIRDAALEMFGSQLPQYAKPRWLGWNKKEMNRIRGFVETIETLNP